MDLTELAKQITALSETVSSLKGEIVSEVSSSILSEVDKKNQGLAANLSRDIKKQAEENKNFMSQFTTQNEVKEEPEKEKEAAKVADKDRTTLKALQKQIAKLESDIQVKEEALFASQRNSQLDTLLSARKSLYPDRARKAFLMENQDKLVRDNGNWYLQENEDSFVELDSAVDSFLESDFGSTFLPPTRKKGLGLKSGGEINTPKTGELSLNEAILADN